MTVFALKIIAVISMFLDHVRYAIPMTAIPITEYLGRLAFPIFSFVISEGFVHTHSKTKYMLRMLIFAIVSQIPFNLFAHKLVHSASTLNIMFTFEYALIGLYIYEFFKNQKEFPKFFKWCSVIISLSTILFVVYLVHPDYSWYGVCCVWIFYLFKNKKILTTFSYIFLTLIYYASKKIAFDENYLIILFSILPIIFVLMYNGKKGKSFKYFFYFFYPVHMMILYLINYF